MVVGPCRCRYDGYRLTYLGYDYLAIKALVNRGVIAGVGRQVGSCSQTFRKVKRGLGVLSLQNTLGWVLGLFEICVLLGSVIPLTSGNET